MLRRKRGIGVDITEMLDIACPPLGTLWLPCQPSELPLSGVTLAGAMAVRTHPGFT